MASPRDPALDIEHQHTHAHLHHSRAASPSPSRDVKYVRGTSLDHSTVPKQLSPNVDSEKKDFASKEVDAEKGSSEATSEDDFDATGRRRRIRIWYKANKWVLHGFIQALVTAWWVSGLVLHHADKNWVVPFLFWLAVTFRMLTLYVPVSLFMKPLKIAWKYTGVAIMNVIPEKLRIPLAAAGTVAVIMVGSFVSEEVGNNTRDNRAVSLFGLAFALFALWFTSRDRKNISWQPVITGMLIQFIIALFVLRTGVGYDIFDFISGLARSLLGFANEGTAFLFSQSTVDLHWFATGVLPAIIFFIALVQMLFHWGTIQWFISKFATFFFWSMKVSGAEAVVAAASPFIGQGESAMLIRPFIAHLTMAELHQVMCSGFATIAGSVLVAYISMGLPAQALISSCVMSIPASLAVSKLRYPETEESLTAGKVIIPDDDEHESVNSLHAFASGAWLGIKIAGMIAATLLCILGFLGLLNGLLGWFGSYWNIEGPRLSVQMILGYLFIPVSFLLGVPRNEFELRKVAELIGIKVAANEFLAYTYLTDPTLEYVNLSARSKLIATYALCGFGNIGSLGTQIGVLSQLAPNRGGDVSRLAFSALVSGIISTLTSAAIAGLLVTNEAAAIVAR